MLGTRLRAIARSANQRLRLSVNTRDRPAFDPSFALRLDWAPDFAERASDEVPWESTLLPALKSLSEVVIPHARDRGIALSGFLSLPTAVALGSAFVETAGVPVDWHQAGEDADAPWSLSAGDEPVQASVSLRPADVAATDVAVLASITDDVENAFGETARSLPAMRVTVHLRSDSLPLRVATPGEAATLARMIRIQFVVHAESTELPARCICSLPLPPGLRCSLASCLTR
jgi:hypothetical protein